MPNHRDDEPDSMRDEPTDEPTPGESIADIGEDDESLFDEDDDTLDDGAIEDEDTTEEVGSEGGSPGGAVTRRGGHVGDTRGSEATSTWGPLDNEPVSAATRDDTGARRRPTE